MTVCAWDGYTLASDKQSTAAGGLKTISTKIHRIRDCLVFGSGHSDEIASLKAWFERGADHKDWPSFANNNNPEVAPLIVITPERHILRYETQPYPVRLEVPFYAIGSGRDYAIAAMHLGCNAQQAVEVACLYDAGCGMGIDVLRFED